MLFVTKLHFSEKGNGGQQRTYFLLKELSRHFNLTIISPYHSKNELDIDADFIANRSVTLKKTANNSIFLNLLFKILNGLFFVYDKKKSIHQTNVDYYLLKKQLKSLKRHKRYRDIDIVVFDTLSAVVSLESKNYKHRILNAHNFDSELAENNISNKIGLLGLSQTNLDAMETNLATLKRFESNIDAYFTEIWVCSAVDELKFISANPVTHVNFFVLPNGSDTDSRQFQPIQNANYKKFLFVGSLNYFPNVNGLKWFIETIFKKLPNDFVLNIVGKSSKKEDFKFLETHSNINLIGQVEDVEPYYAEHEVLVVPLWEGSGTRLKILEALSYGKLVLSTKKGIEGINAKNGLDFLEFNDYQTFQSNVMEKLDDYELLEKIRRNGRQLMNSYSWKGIVTNYVNQRYAK